MSKGRLRFAPSVLARLGEELTEHLDQGLVELVKNAYDADARQCIVRLVDVGRPGGTIVVEDNGIGMRPEQIEAGWLLIGGSSKSTSQRTRQLRRIPVGNKGLGRLSALRAGRSVQLLTRSAAPNGKVMECEQRIDWSWFDAAQTVEEVEIETTEREAPPNATAGTTIRIEGLRHQVGRVDVKRLARGLVMLSDPFGSGPSGFEPALEAPEFEDLQRLVSQRYFEAAEFHLRAALHSDGTAEALVTDYMGNELFRALHSDLRKDGVYAAPAATLDLWAFLLESTSFVMRRASLSDIRAWLKEFGGVHLYRNGIRVHPYGSPGDDWLGLNLARAKSPDVRPSTNNAIGRVCVDGDAIALGEKTDRSGLIESDAFANLRQFATDALEWMASRRLAEKEQERVARRKAAPRDVETAKRHLEEAVQKLALAPPQAADLTAHVLAYDQAYQSQVTTLEKEVQLYRTVSTAGIVAAVFAHELAHPADNALSAVRRIEHRARTHDPAFYAAKLGEHVEAVKAGLAHLDQFSEKTLSLLSSSKRRSTRAEVHQAIGAATAMLAPFLDRWQIVVIRELGEGIPYLRGSVAALESIVCNLVINSAAFLKEQISERIVRITTRSSDQMVWLEVSDNGPGIANSDLPQIWAPGFSTRPGGTGLGLTIVKDVVADLGGKVEAQGHGELGGATLIVSLPILGR